MLTSSRAEEWFETKEFRWENVDCEFPSRSPAIPSKALLPEPYMFLSFPNLRRSSLVSFKIKPKNEVVYRLTIQSQECMQIQSSFCLGLTSAFVDTKDCMSSSISFNCCSCCVMLPCQSLMQDFKLLSYLGLKFLDLVSGFHLQFCPCALQHHPWSKNK